MPRVSCLIPSYNHARFLGEAMDSALGQTFSDLEVIVRDDASTDATPEVLDAYADRERVTIHRQSENRGVSATFNRLVADATGEFLAFLPSDDRWLPGHLARSVEALDAKGDAAFSWGRARIITTEGAPSDAEIPWADRAPEDLFAHLLFGGTNPIPFQATLLRREMLESAPFDPEIVGIQDYDLWLRLSARHPAVFVPETLVEVRFHEGQVSHRTPETKLRFHAERVRMLEKAFRTFPDPIEARGRERFVSRLADLHRRLSRHHRKAGQREEARRHVRRSLELNPWQPALWFRSLW